MSTLFAWVGPRGLKFDTSAITSPKFLIFFGGAGGFLATTLMLKFPYIIFCWNGTFYSLRCCHCPTTRPHLSLCLGVGDLLQQQEVAAFAFSGWSARPQCAGQLLVGTTTASSSHEVSRWRGKKKKRTAGMSLKSYLRLNPFSARVASSSLLSVSNIYCTDFGLF